MRGQGEDHGGREGRGRPHILDRTMSAMSLRQERTCLCNQEEASMATVRKSRGERCQMQRAEAGAR